MSSKRFGGWSLAVYHWEAETYPEFKEVTFEKKRAMFYLKKFARHFKTTCPSISSCKKRGGGHYTPSFYFPRIALPENPNLSLVAHEYAHHLDAVRNPETPQWHGKSFRRELKKVYTFAKRYLPNEKVTPIGVTPY